MKNILIFLVFIYILFKFTAAFGVSNLVELACKRNSTLKLCPKINLNISADDSFTNTSDWKKSSQNKLPINLHDFHVFKQLAEQTLSVDNPFKDDNLLIDQDLIDFESGETKKSRREDDETNRFLRTGNFVKAPTGDNTRTEKYCNKYHENYAYYCGDSIDKTPSLKEHLFKFCPSYESNCPDKAYNKPSNPFITKSPIASPVTNFPDINNIPLTAEQIAAEKKLAALKKAHPCTPHCDQRIHKHCTAECKCDYLYPYVQRFCNPPPIPFFLNTCRLWYHGCPKYQAYHYASQYIYSKAEKGKTVGGLAAPARGTPGNPYYLNPAVTNPGVPVVAAKGELTSAVRPEKAKELANKANNFEDPFEIARAEYFKEKNIKPKALQTSSAAVAPNAADLLGDGNFHQFDSYSDHRGVSYRARSRSPFSKPGLWEANPDDPHNRDHANKWYYHPDSVGVDWLSGQIQWGRHWAVPAAGTGGTDGFSAVHFPTIGNFLNIADDYD